MNNKRIQVCRARYSSSVTAVKTCLGLDREITVISFSFVQDTFLSLSTVSLCDKQSSGGASERFCFRSESSHKSSNSPGRKWIKRRKVTKVTLNKKREYTGRDRVMFQSAAQSLHYQSPSRKLTPASNLILLSLSSFSCVTIGLLKATVSGLERGSPRSRERLFCARVKKR